MALWILANWKWMVLGTLGATILFFSFKIYGVYKDNQALLEERAGKITQLVKDNTEAEIAKQSAELTIARMLADEARIEKLYRGALVLQRVAKVEAQKQTDIFKNHNFTKLSNAKPGLIVIRMNNATQERFNELANTFNN